MQWKQKLLFLQKTVASGKKERIAIRALELYYIFGLESCTKTGTYNSCWK